MVALLVVTLTQLEAFVLVARLGSVTAAARTLGVSEPAISGALAALRRQLGDELVVRGAGGMTLTPGGRRLIGIASQMVNLGIEAEAAIRQANGAPERLRVTATAAIAESVAPALLAALTSRAGRLEVSLGVASIDEMPVILQERLADVALGPRISGPVASGLDCMPLFRYRLVIVAPPSHPYADRAGLSLRDLAGQTWLVDPDAADAAAPVAKLLARLEVPEERIRVFGSQAAAWAAVADGDGIAPAIGHVVLPEVERKAVVVLPVAGTPIELMWHATTLTGDRCSPGAAALRRFIGTPHATHAMNAPLKGVAPSRFRPPVFVTLWS